MEDTNLIPEFSINTFFGSRLEFLDEVDNNIGKIGIIGVPYYFGLYISDFGEESLENIKKESMRFADINSSFYYLEKNDQNREIIYLGDFKFNDKTEIFNIDEVLKKIYEKLYFPVFIGGDHSISYVLVKSLLNKYKSDDIIVLHLDAHTDRTDFKIEECDLKQGNVISMIEQKLNIDVISYGIRGIIPNTIKSNFYSLKELKDKIKGIKEKKLYITCDFDVFDTSFISSVSYPVAEGISFSEYKLIIDEVFKNNIDIVGIDFVEYNSSRGVKDISASNASQVIYYTLNKFRRL